MSKTALVIGATGLVGREILLQLLEDQEFEQISIFTRRPVGIGHPGLNEHIVDFDQPEQWHGLLKGDVLFSALGTTIKAAGSKDAQYKVDYTYQYQAALAAAKAGVSALVLISSSGASSKSRIFYSRMKGELDDAVSKLAFNKIRILRPSLLTGQREKPRATERFAELIANALLPLLPALRKYRPVPGSTVARTAILSPGFEPEKRIRIIGPEEIFEIAGPNIL